MQYGRLLDHLPREIFFAEPALGPVYMLKADMLYGFYRIGIRPEYTPKLGLILPSGANEEPMVATPLTLLAGWKIPSLILNGHVNGSGYRK